jgi:lipopolysaccharide transport system permease protein
MVGVIDGFRWALLGWRTSSTCPGFLLSSASSPSSLARHPRYFRRTERTFADLI